MRPTLRARILVTTLAAACLAAGTVAPASAGSPAARCADRADTSPRLALRVKGQRATGHYALPAKSPRVLVVIAHGFGHTSFSWRHHMRRFAGKLGVASVAMDFRGLRISPDANGDGLPESRGLPILAGAQDTVAAARHFLARCPSIRRVVLVAVSGGGPMAGLALAQAAEIRRPGGAPLFDYWLDIEPVTNLVETYAEANLAGSISETAVRGKEDIERECGGTFQENPECYVDRSPVFRVPEIAESGVRGVVVVHALDDGLVPYNQSRELVAALGAAAVPVDLYTIGRRSAKSERETTLTGYVGGQVQDGYTSPLAGHGSEKSTTHIVMVTAFQRLAELVRGRAPGPYREFVVDGQEGTFALVPPGTSARPL